MPELLHIKGETVKVVDLKVYIYIYRGLILFDFSVTTSFNSKLKKTRIVVDSDNIEAMEFPS